MNSDASMDQDAIDEVPRDSEDSGDCVEIKTLREYAPIQPLRPETAASRMPFQQAFTVRPSHLRQKPGP
jgi:hypothetical protein